MNCSTKYFSAIILLTMILSGCTYSPPETRVIIKDVSRKPGSRTFAAALFYQKLQHPTGIINTFPNGGISKVLEQSAIFYVCDFESKEITRLIEIEVPSDMRVSSDVSLGRWESDKFYFLLSGCPGSDGAECYGDLRNIESYELDLDGNYSPVKIPRNKFSKPGGSLAQMPGEKVYMRLTKNDNTIKVLTEDGGEYEDFAAVDKKIKGLISIYRD